MNASEVPTPYKERPVQRWANRIGGSIGFVYPLGKDAVIEYSKPGLTIGMEYYHSYGSGEVGAFLSGYLSIIPGKTLTLPEGHDDNPYASDLEIRESSVTGRTGIAWNFLRLGTRNTHLLLGVSRRVLLLVKACLRSIAPRYFKSHMW